MCIRDRYEVLPAVHDLDEAIADGAPQLYEQFPNNIIERGCPPFGPTALQELVIGDIEKGFEECAVVVEGTSRYETVSYTHLDVYKRQRRPNPYDADNHGTENHHKMNRPENKQAQVPEIQGAAKNGNAKAGPIHAPNWAREMCIRDRNGEYHTSRKIRRFMLHEKPSINSLLAWYDNWL